MSYDVYIEVDTGGKEPFCIDRPRGNYTSNVSPMWAKCLTAALAHVPEALKWCGNDDMALIARGTTGIRKIRTDRLCLRDLQGQPAGELVPLLTEAIKWGWAHLDELAEDNPSNGWGDAEGAIGYLNVILEMCEAHPNGRLDISS